MDGNNWRAAQAQAQGGGVEGGGAAAGAMDSGDWRTQLLPDSRQRIVNKIMETLKRHLPVSGQEGVQELKKIAVRFEEKIYSAATSQQDYLRKISLKMLTMETKSQPPMTNPMQPNPASSGQNGLGPGQNPNPVPMGANQTQTRQPLLQQNIQNNIPSTGLQNSSSLAPALPPVSNLTQSTLPNVVGQNSNLQTMQNMPNVGPNSVGNAIGQGMPPNMVANSQRQMPGRQQQVVSQQQQQQSQTTQQYLYQQQLHHHQIMKQKFQPGSTSQSLMQPHMQQQQQQQPQEQQQQPPQQQQNLLQPTQTQPSQQAVMQPSSIQSTSLSNLQQNQQSTQSGLHQRQQSVMRQQPAPMLHQQQSSMLQQSILPAQQHQQQQQQQQQLIAQQTNLHQNQLMGQQNTMPDVQQRLVGQQNNYNSLQQQQLLNQQNNFQNMHQQQLGSQSNIAGVQQQQLSGSQQPGNSGLTSNQHPIHMMQQPKVPVQQQMLQSTTTLLPQGQQSQSQPAQQQMMSQSQSQPGQLPAPLGLQQQTNQLQREMQQRLQPSAPLLQQQNAMEQQKQLYQSQRVAPEASSTSLDSTAQTGNANAADWQEEVYQKIKSMKELYLAELNDLYHKIASKVQQHDSLPQRPQNEQIEKLKMFKITLERIVLFLRLNKQDIQHSHKEKLVSVEKHISFFLSSNRPRSKPSSSPLQGQSSMQLQQPQSLDGQTNPSMLPVQGSMAAMPQNNLTNLQHNSLSGVPTISNSQQHMINTVQPGSSVDLGQGNSLNSLQQVTTGSLQQNPVHSPQQVNISALNSQSGTNPVQANLGSLQQNSNALQQSLPEQHEQQLLQNQQQLRQQYHHRQMQQQLFQRQQLVQQQTTLLPTHQMSQLQLSSMHLQQPQSPDGRN